MNLKIATFESEVISKKVLNLSPEKESMYSI